MAQSVGSAKVDIEVDASKVEKELVAAMSRASDRIAKVLAEGFGSGAKAAEQSTSGLSASMDDVTEAANRAAEAGAKSGDGVAKGAERAEGAAAGAQSAMDDAASAAHRMGEAGAAAGADTAKGAERAGSAAASTQKAMDAAAGAAERMGSTASGAMRGVESAELKLAATRSKATRDVIAAEEALTRARASGNTDAVASAEAKLGEVRARSTASVIDAEDRLTAARRRAADEASKAGGAAASGMDKASAAAGAAATSMGKVEAAAAGAGQAASNAGGQAASGLNRGEAAAGKLFSTLGKIAAIAGPVAGIGAIISSGFKRSNDLERADIIFQNIGLSASETESQLAKLTDQVTGTSLSLSDAAKYSAAFAQSGVEMGKPMDDAVKALTNISAAAQGTGTDVGIVMQQISSAGKLMGGDAMQLQQAGVNIYKYVSDYMGKSVQEVKKLGEEGKITFDDVVNSINMGMGDLAKELGETLPAKFANFKTSLASLGAAGTEPFRPMLISALGFGTTLLKEVTPRVREVSEQIADLISKGPGLGRIFDSAQLSSAINSTKALFGQLADVVEDLGPAAAELGSAFAKASAMVGISTWELFVDALRLALTALEAIAPALKAVTGLLNDHPSILAAAMTGWLAFKTIPAIIGRVTEPLRMMNTMIVSQKDAAAQAGRQMGTLRAAYAGTAGMMQQKIPLLGQMSTAYGTAAAAGGKLRGAMAGIKTAGAGVMNALGGPLGIALAGATVAIMSASSGAKKLKDAQDAAADSAKNLASYQRDLKAAAGDMDQVFSAIAEQVDNLSQNLEESAGTHANFFERRFGSMWENVKQATSGGVDGITGSIALLQSGMAGGIAEITGHATTYGDAMYLANNNAAESSKLAKEALDELGLSSEEAAKMIGGSKGQYDDYIASLAGMGEKGQAAIAVIQPLRDEFLQMQSTNAALSPGMVELSGAIGVLADESASAEDKVNALKVALDMLSGGRMSATDAAFAQTEQIKQLQDVIDRTVESSTNLGDVWNENANTLNTSNEALLPFHSELQGLSDTFLQSALASGDAIGSFAGIQPVLDELQGVLGLTDEQMQQLLQSYGMVPEHVQTLIDVQGSDEASEQVATVVAAMQAYPPDLTTTAYVKDEQARAALEAMGFKITEYDQKTGTATITADNKQAIDGAAAAWGAVDGVDGKTAETFMNGNPTGAEVAAGAATDAVNGVPGDHDTDLTAQDGVTTIANMAKIAVESIPGYKEIKLVVSKIGDWMGLGDNYKGGLFKGAPRYASGGWHPGYRLPTSGPGTDERDGFLAFDQMMRPAALVDAGEWIINRSSSEKYNKELAAINAGVFPKLPGFARGGGIGVGGGIDDPEPLVIAGQDIAAALLSGVAPVLQQMRAAIPADMPAPAMSGPADTATVNVEGSAEGSNFSDGFADAAESMIGTAEGSLTPMWDAQVQKVTDFGTQVATTVQQVAAPAWANFATTMNTVKTSVIDPTVAGVQQGVINTGQQFLNQTNGVINPAWINMGQQMLGVKTGTIDPVFAGVQGGLVNTAQAFATNTSNMISEWGRLREGAAAPVRFVIGTVFNDGLVGAWNAVSDMLDTKKMAPYPLRFATGGHVQGPGGPTDDKIPALLSDGEYVINAAAVNRIGTANLDALNYGGVQVAPEAFRNRKEQERLLNDATFQQIASKYAGGGIVKGDPAWKQIKRGMDWAASRHGRPYVLGGSADGAGGTDCSGYMSGIADVIGGGTGARQWATMSFNGGGNAQHPTGPQGFVAGLEAGFSVGVKNGGAAGGHTAGTIGGLPGLPATNVESGGSHGNVAFGGPAVGADHSQFPTQYHLPNKGGRFVSGGGGGSIYSMIDALVSEHWGPVEDKVKNANFPGLVGQELPGAAAGKIKEAFDAKIGKLMEEFSGDPGGSGAERWRPLAKRAMAMVGFDPTNKAQVDAMIAQIQSESGGNPSILQGVQDVNSGGNEAQGLLQIIPGTFAAHRDPSLPNDRTHPLANMVAALRYYKSRYGNDLTTTWGHGHGYDNGGMLEPTPGGFGTYYNHTGAPEYVLTKSQWTAVASNAVAVAKLVDPLRVLARDMRDLPDALKRLPGEFADRVSSSPMGAAVMSAAGAAGAAVWSAVPAPVKAALGEVDRAGRTWGYVSDKLNEKAWAWARGQWPITGDPTDAVKVVVDGEEIVSEPETPVDNRMDFVGWKQPSLDESLVNMTGWNLLAAQKIANQEMKPGNDPVSRAIYDVFGRAPILPELARIYSRGDRYTLDAIDAAFETIETGNTEALSKFTHETSQLTQAILGFRQVAIDTGKAVKGAMDVVDRAQVSAQAWIRGDWVQVDEEHRLPTPGEMLDQTLGNMFAENANEAGGYVGLGNMVTAPKIVEDDGLVVLPREYLDALKEQANPEATSASAGIDEATADLSAGVQAGDELASELSDAVDAAESLPSVTASGDTIATVTAKPSDTTTDSQRPIQIDVVVNVNGAGDPMAVSRAVENRMKQGLETAIGGTVRAL